MNVLYRGRSVQSVFHRVLWISSFYYDNMHVEVLPDELWLGGNRLSTLFK
jgi:hypothetical protein